MSLQILMPALSPAMEEGTLAKWLVREGDRVRPGDLIAEIDTEKAIVEIEAVDSGTVTRLLVPEGTKGVRVHTPIAELSGEESVPTPHAAAHPKPMPAPAPGTTVREALREAIAVEMRRDDDVVLIGVDVGQGQGAYRISQGLYEEFGSRRVIDAPIAEQGLAGLAIGAAFAGLRPVVEFMTFNLSMQAIGQVVNSAARTRYMSGGALRCPIVFRGPSGASAQVGAQHSQDFAAWYAHVPGLKVIQPYTAGDAKDLLKAAIRDDGPVIFLENEVLYGRAFPMPDGGTPAEIGKARLCREGQDITLASFGIGMSHALAAADILADEGISAEVLDLRTIRPLDSAAVIASVKKTTRCITIEEGLPFGSVGSQISALLMREAFDELAGPVITITGKDVPMPYAASLERLALPAATEVAEAARALIAR